MSGPWNWFRNRAIRLQLIASIAGVQALLMTLLVLGLVNRQQAFLVERARDRTLLQSDLLAAASVQQLLTSDLAGITPVLANLKLDRTVRFAMVTDSGGRVLAHTDTARQRQYLHDPSSLAVLTGSPKRRIVAEIGNVIEAASPVIANDELLGWAWIAGDLSPDRDHVAYVARSGIFYTLSAILLGGIVAVLLARTIMRPLRLLLKGAGRLALDHLDEPIPVTGRNEIGVVTRAFNDAMERLRRQREELAHARADLEARVRKRTEELSRVNLELQRARDELEDRVAQRTAELEDANRSLQLEISERRRAENALVRRNEDLKVFAYAASHDLQAPLRSILGFAQLLERRYKGQLDAEADEFILDIVQAAGRMQKLIRGVLEYSKAAAAQETPPHPVDSNTVVSFAIANLADAIAAEEAVVTCDPLPPVMADDVPLLQVFQNLIGNAIKYRSEEQPRVQVAARREGDVVEFEVTDNGRGIAPESQAKVFRMFQRAGEDDAGTGIGLAICAKIVQRYGGRIWVESKPGQGSSFRFTLPLAGL